MNYTIQTVVFDMDGLIFDSERLYVDLYKRAEPEFGIDLPESAYIDCVGTTREKTREIILEYSAGAGLDFEAFRREIDRAFDEYRVNRGLPVKTGARELIEKLYSIGIPLGVASSSARNIVEANLKHADLFRYFSSIIGGDEITRGKPAPDIYQKSMSNLNAIPEKTLAFEDSEAGIYSALSAGMRVVAVPDLKRPPEEVLASVYRVFDDLRDALDNIDELLR